MSQFNSDTPPMPAKQPRNGGRGFVASFLVLGMGIMFAILVPALTRAREDARQTVCFANLRAIGFALRMYSVDKDGKFPPNLQVLVSEDYGLDSETLRCPNVKRNNGKKVASDYFYLPPASIIDDHRKIIACDLKSNHRKGRNVLYLDGHVEFLNNDDFRAELKLPYNSAFAEALRQKERSP